MSSILLQNKSVTFTPPTIFYFKYFEDNHPHQHIEVNEFDELPFKNVKIFRTAAMDDHWFNIRIHITWKVTYLRRVFQLWFLSIRTLFKIWLWLWRLANRLIDLSYRPTIAMGSAKRICAALRVLLCCTLAEPSVGKYIHCSHQYTLIGYMYFYFVLAKNSRGGSGSYRV